VPWHVLTVRMTDHGAPTVCAVLADRCDRGPLTASWWLGDTLVYSAPADRILEATEHPGQIEAQAVARARQLDLCEKGLQGPEYQGMRPSAGASAVRAAMIERVVPRLATDARTDPTRRRLP